MNDLTRDEMIILRSLISLAWKTAVDGIPVVDDEMKAAQLMTIRNKIETQIKTMKASEPKTT